METPSKKIQLPVKLRSLVLASALGLGSFLGADFFVEFFNKIVGTSYSSTYAFFEGVWIYVSRFPFRVISSVSWSICVVLGFYGFFLLFGKLQKQRTILRMVGLRAYLPRETAEAKRESWKDCVGHLKDPLNSEIMIMGANGWDTFAADGAPLREVIDDFRGQRMRILLMHPRSQFLEERAGLAGEDSESYRDNLVRSIRHCHNLRKRGNEIELRLYDRLPGWKTIFSHDRLWLQHYAAKGPVEDMPVYSFGKVPSEHSMYKPFMIEFNRQWERAEEVPLRKLSKTQLVKQFLEEDSPLPELHRCASCEFKEQASTSPA